MKKLRLHFGKGNGAFSHQPKVVPFHPQLEAETSEKLQ